LCDLCLCAVRPTGESKPIIAGAVVRGEAVGTELNDYQQDARRVKTLDIHINTPQKRETEYDCWLVALCDVLEAY
jgi:hypothetical protein